MARRKEEKLDGAGIEAFKGKFLLLKQKLFVSGFHKYRG
jgi:hypothetical protein